MKRVVIAAFAILALVSAASAQVLAPLGPGSGGPSSGGGGGSSGGVTIGAPITGSCTNGFDLFNNGGLIGCHSTSGTGTVTSIGLGVPAASIFGVSGSPVTAAGTLGLTVTGTAGGIPYFDTTSTLSTSAALAANALVVGGGAGSAPATVTTGTGVLTALGVNVGSAGAFVTFNGALGTPSSGTATNLTGLPISTGVSGLGTGVATALGNTAGGAGGFALVGTTPPTGTAGGDLIGTYPNPTFAAVITAGGPTGSATVAPIITYDAKGRLTAVTSATITPAVGSVTGLGTGVATALGVNIGTAGSFVVNGGALGTPSSGVATNLTGTASGLTAGNVTTNANLTGPITSVGNATSIAAQTGTGSTFVVSAAPTITGVLTASGNLTLSGNGAASAAVQLLSGTLFTGGTGTTTFPHMLFQPTGTAAVTAWATTGTVIGINAVSGFTGNFVDFHAAGAASVFSVAGNGNLTAAGLTSSGSIVDGATGVFQWNGRGTLSSPAAGSVQSGGTDVDTNAAIVAQLTRSQGTLAGGTADQAGKNWTFIASPSKGAALGGAFIFQTTPSGSTGTVVNAPVTRVSILPTGGLSVGSATLTLTGGALGMDKIIASGSAPGAGGGKLELVCGTNSGTAKLIIAAGTSATAVTVIDNIGAGVTGC